MAKKLLIFVLIGGFLTLIGSDKPRAENDWHFRGSGGVVFTQPDLKMGDFEGTAEFGFLRTVWGSGKVAVGYQYWDLNSDTVNVENHAGKVYISARDLRELRFTPYIFSAGLFTHGNGEKSIEPNFNGGFGLLVPVAGFVPFFEAGASKVSGEWFYSLLIGWQIPLDPKRK